MSDMIFGYSLDLKKINSMTKYPSIETYHLMGEKGILREDPLSKDFAGCGELEVTEKIDGTNGRIILFGGDFLIGSREEIVYAKGDRIINTASEDLVNALLPIANHISEAINVKKYIYTFYSEAFGGDIGVAARQYTAIKQLSYKLFDITTISMEELDILLKKDLPGIASWRDHGGQNFYDYESFKHAAGSLNLKMAPILDIIDGYDFPITLQDTYDYMNRWTDSRVVLDQVDANKYGRSEGIVVRSKDRKVIRKLRFEDYERTKRKVGF